MTDETTDDTVKATETTTSPYPKPKPGQEDAGHIVSGAMDQPMSGTLADITDGDHHDILHHSKKK